MAFQFHPSGVITPGAGTERPLTMAGRTSFVIAHRLSTIKKADCILVIENSRISEMGGHTVQIRARGHY